MEKIKNKDDFKWEEYTERYYSKQILNEIMKVHSLLIKKFVIEDNIVQFDDNDNIHPNWKEIYHQVILNNVESVFECGCGTGQHLKNISILNQDIDIAGCDLLKSQVEFGRELLKLDDDFVKKIKIMDFSLPNAYELINKQYELVYTQAVTMHLTTEKVINFIRNMLLISSKYVLLVENIGAHDYESIFKQVLLENNLDFKITRTSKYLTSGMLLIKQGV